MFRKGYFMLDRLKRLWHQLRKKRGDFGKGVKMEARNYWLNCTVTSGMTPGEYSIEIKTADGKEISLFAPEGFVDEEKGLLRVDILEKTPKSYLVYLPAAPFEVGSRFVNVPKEDVK